MEINAELLRKHLRDRMNDVTDSMATGACQDFAAYRRMNGVIEGLAYAERMLLDMVDAAIKAQGGGDE
jgi:hypothetical protein